jgi:hypothetical protein
VLSAAPKVGDVVGDTRDSKVGFTAEGTAHIAHGGAAVGLEHDDHHQIIAGIRGSKFGLYVLIETPRATMVNEGQAIFISARESFMGNIPMLITIHQRHCIRSLPLHAQDSDQFVEKDDAKIGRRLNLFRVYHETFLYEIR